MNIYEKLGKIQAKLEAPKNQYNSFGKYKYRSCEDILEGLKPHLIENNCSVVVSDEMVVLGDRFYIKATATLIDNETTENNSVSVSGYAREAETKKGMDDSQITGSTSSYARKYALNGLFAIDDTKDADSRDNREQSIGKKQEDKGVEKPMNKSHEKRLDTTISEQQRGNMYAMAKGEDEIFKAVLQQFGYSDSKSVKEIDYMKICKEIQKAIGA